MKKIRKNMKKNTKNNIKKAGKNINKNIIPKKMIDKEEDAFQIEGRNAVMEALNNNRTIDKIFMKKGEIEGTLKVIKAKAIDKGILVQEVDKQKLENMKRTNNAQGVIALCPAHEYCHVLDIIENAKNKGEEPFIIVLDEITDPHNLGAIIRTANVSGAHGVIIPKRRAVSLTAVVNKTSAGALEYVPVARVSNISKELIRLKKEGIWVACADMKGTEHFKANLKGAIALVIGNEGEGVSRLVKETCDFSVKIPMYGEIESLNASTAASVLMYEVVRQRKFL